MRAKWICGASCSNLRFSLLISFLGLILIIGRPEVNAANPILFVTQVPQPTELNDNVISNVFLGVGAGFGNHLGATLYAPRGGDLWLGTPNGSITSLTLTNLTRSLGFGVAGVQHTNGIAVRDPAVHWSGARALFSMVVGAPKNSADTNVFFWQLYELTGLPNGPYAISKVAAQPTNYNNVTPCYSPDGRIIFASDRPRDGSPHLYPQLDEYNDFPTVTGLWSLDPASGDLHLLNHTPSGVFSPSVDSYGRLVFIRWDHLVQDRNATDDRIATITNGIPVNGTFNYQDESAGSAYDLNDRLESFPEPRTFDGTNLIALKVNGNAFNSFFPWTTFLDGSGEEVLNHMGRHDFLLSFKRSFTNDSNLIDFNIVTRTNPLHLVPNLFTNWINNFYWIREDARTNGVYFGIDSPDFGTHAAGQIVTFTAPLNTNADYCYITYITPKTTFAPNSYGVYRNPLPMSDGSLLAAFATNTPTADSNAGTVSAPQSRYPFRLYSLKQTGAVWVADKPLTPGLSNSPSGPVVQYVNGLLVTNSGPLWEFYPVEIRSNPAPPILANPINGTEQQVFDEEGVDVALFQKYLRANNLALVVSHNVTRRDHADQQQPFNLRIAGTTNLTWGPTNAPSPKLYDIAHIQFLQADQRRGYTAGRPAPAPGRRVLATPLHDPAADNVPDTNGLAGSLKLADDGSFAALVPARRAMTHHLLGTNNESIVKERYWITYQPGEIRTCKNCHGINSSDQTGINGPPNNPAQALRDLLRYWKTQNTPVLAVQTNGNTNYLAIQFKRRAAVTNVTHTVEISADLSNWLAGSTYNLASNAPNSLLTTEVSRTGTSTETIVVRENAPLGSVPRRFMRVRVSSP
jgi:Hydrazine synthase alpha subunit middle domain/WD40-like Beta Propeller Repeat